MIVPNRRVLALLVCFLGVLTVRTSFPRANGLRASFLEAANNDIPTLTGLAGDQLTGADLEQGEVILVIWASWSPRCRDIAARVNALARAWSPRARVATVVFQEEAEVVRAFLKGQAGRGFNVPVYLDTSGSFSKKFGVTTLPGLLVIQDGRAEFQGKLPMNPDAVISRVLGPKP